MALPATGLFCLALVVGCTKSVRVDERLFYPQTFDVVKRIQVVPFENLTPFPEAGLIVSDLVADEMRAWQGYEVQDRHAIEARARSGEYALPLHWGRPEAVKFGRALGADLVVSGTILEFGYLREHRGLTERATFAVVARLVSTQSGRVIWSGTMLGTSGSDLSPTRPPLMDVTGNVLENAFAKLFRSYETYRELQQKQAADQDKATAAAPAAKEAERTADTSSPNNDGDLEPGQEPDRDVFGLGEGKEVKYTLGEDEEQ